MPVRVHSDGIDFYFFNPIPYDIFWRESSLENVEFMLNFSCSLFSLGGQYNYFDIGTVLSIK